MSFLLRFNPVQLDKIRARLACNGQATHNHHVLSILCQAIFQQALFDERDQVLGCSLHGDTVRPDAPPERELVVDVVGGSIGQDGDAWTII